MRLLGKLVYFLSAIAATVPPALAAPVCDAKNSVAQELNLPVYEWHDPSAPVKGTVVAIHGLTFYAEAYNDFAKHLAEKGYRVYAADMRGFGSWKTDSKKFGGDENIHFTQSKDDLVKLLTYVRKNNDTKTICLGESLGANIALSLAAEHPELIDATLVSAPCIKTCVHPRARWAIDFWKGLIHPNKPFNLEPYISPYLSRDKNLTAACMADKHICRRMSVVELIKATKTNKMAIDTITAIPNTMPVLIIAGQKDQVVQAKALPRLVAKMNNKHAQLNVLPNKGHLLIEHQPVDQGVSKVVDGWLEGLQSDTLMLTLSEK